MSSKFMWLTCAVGVVVCLFAVLNLSHAHLDLTFLLLAAITIGISSRITIRIPRSSSHISVSDTFIFLIMLLYGGEAAILVSAAEALRSSLFFSKKPITIAYNPAVNAISTFLSALLLRLCFGNIENLPRSVITPHFVLALCLLGLIQYVSNSGLVALACALKDNQPFWRTWSKYYLWTSLTYFAGASAAGIIARLFNAVGLTSLLVTMPIIAIVFFTYRTYLKSVEVSAAQAEQAERHVQELNRYIAEQERIREQFSQLEKLSALGELASGVAHDFNNTLAGILGRAQLMLRTKDPEKIERGLHIIIKAAEDGAKTVKRIQDFARQRRDKDFGPVWVDQLLFDVSEITRPRWKDRAEASNIHINLELRIASNAIVMGDDSELREVLVNMVFNAVDAMPEGGKLILAAKESDGFIEISVSDTGIGMSQEVRSRIFDPFFTTKGKAGMGLGLAVSYGIISRHEGTIEVTSEIGEGSTFSIKLPTSKLARRATERAESASHMATLFQDAPTDLPALLFEKRRAGILVVDDEACIRNLLRDILEAENCDVTLAEDGHEAIALFNSREFDAVFTDIGMPGMSGWELARAVRDKNREIPIAVITGWGEAFGSHEREEAEVNWVVTKPFSADQIAKIVQKVVEHQSALDKDAAITVAA